MKRALSLIGLLILLAAMVSAADVNGTWKGAFDFEGQSIPLTLSIKGSGEALTGTVEGLPTSPTEIKDGKVNGDSVSFWVTTDYQGNPLKLVYKGIVKGDQIQFTFGTEDGSWSADLTAKRSS